MSLAQRPGLAAVRADAGGEVLGSTGILQVIHQGLGQYDVITVENFFSDAIPRAGALTQDFFASILQFAPNGFSVNVENGALGFVFDDGPFWVIIERIEA